MLISTDAFPPECGGSGWSAYELVKGLRTRGHDVVVVQPSFGGSTPGSRNYNGVEVLEFRSRAYDVPVVRAYMKSERLGVTLSRYLQELIEREQIDLIHAQHALTGPPSVRAARQTQRPVICTVRDYWPICYWGDLRFDETGATLCPACSVGMMTRCVRPRSGALWPLALGVIPYMRRNLSTKRSALGHADAVVAVSGAIARDLKNRCPEIGATRLETIPNMVDLESIEHAVASAKRPLDVPYAVYVGKLSANKGSGLLPEVIERAALSWPLVVIGDGPERASLEAATRSRRPSVRFTGWLPRESVWQWVGHANLLIFPSRGPESLSRVLLEASALGVAVAAMDTGGTSDILTHNESALLSSTADELADHVRHLVSDHSLRDRLGANARRVITERFAAPIVLDRIEALYRSLVPS